VDRRDFIKTLGLGLTALTVAGSTGAALAAEGRPSAESVVALSRADHVFLKAALFSELAYPEGKIDYASVQLVVDGAMGSLTGEKLPGDQWAQIAKGQDRVGIMVDARQPGVPIILVECIVDRLIRAGVGEQAICVFAGSEPDLYAAGYSLNPDSPGVHAFATDTAGFRDGLSLMLLDRLDVIINLARLRPDAGLGMAGAITNHLALVPEPERVALRKSQATLPGVAAQRAVRDKVKLHIVDALNPAYQVYPEVEEPGKRYRWEYGGLLVSRDPVALDAIGRQLLEAKRAEVNGAPSPLSPAPEYIAAAAKRYGLGESDPKLIRLLRSGYAGAELM
jgi:hypothetical protein